MRLTDDERDAPREPLLIQAARRMAETHPHRHIRIVSGSGTTVGGFVEEFDEYMATLTARLAEAWDEGYDAGIADDVIRAYPDIGRKSNPYRAALTPEATP